MAEIRYGVIGSPVQVTANCDDISVTICWTGRTIFDDECNDQYRDERICSAITIDPGDTELTGSIVWNGVPVNYVIKRSCPPLPPVTCETTCDLVELYTVPSKVPENYEYPIDIHYNYFVTCEGDDYVGSRTRNIGVKSVPLSEFNEDDDKCYTFKTNDGCERQICLGDREDPCATGTDLYISVSLSKTVIPPNLSDDEGNPVFDDDWKMLPADECFDDEGHPVPITDDPEESQCHAADGEIVEGELEKYPRYDENNKPIPYYTVYVSIVYKLVETDENCNKITETGMLKYPWHIPPCVNGCVITGTAGGRVILEKGSDGTTNGSIKSNGGEITFSIGTQKPTPETHPCCFDRTITGETSIESLIEELAKRKKIGSEGDIKSVYYNGVKRNRDSNITYSVKMLAKKDGECSGVCTQSDKYGVVSGTTKVYYETEYMSDKWVSEDTPTCDCNALTLYDKDSGYVDSPYSVPFYGGRIKVEWDYVRHSVSDECDDYYTYGTWEEIIMIGGCDERPTDCNVCNGHGSSQGEPVDGCDCDALQIFDTECKVCDAECCYDDFGGKCSLLFKEQFPEFWNDMLMCDNGESKLTIYKCKKCGALIPVMSDADDCKPSVPKDEMDREWCPSCERVEEGILEPIVFNMNHEYVETPYYICPNEDCHANLQSPGLNDGCEYEPPGICPFCGQEWYYDEEKPNSGVTGEWYNKVRYEFKQDCNKVCDYKTYVTYDHITPDPIPCEGGDYSFSVSYTSTTEFLGEGCPPNKTVVDTETISGSVGKNPGDFARTIIDDDRITLIQSGCEKAEDTCGCGALIIQA